MAVNKSKFMTCTVNDKFKFPFTRLNEVAERNSKPSNMRLTLSSPGLTYEEVEYIKESFTDGLLELAGKEGGVATIKCESQSGQLVFSSKAYSYLAMIEVVLNETDMSWKAQISFLYTKPNNGVSY